MSEEKLVPKLRFSGFNDEWKSFKLNEISDRITRKNKSLETDRPLTISAQFGLVDQIEYFNKIVASKSLKNYYLLNNGEFAYNKSYSNGYPFGAVKRLDDYENGAISTLYICFDVNDKMNSDLLKEYFETDKWYKEIYKIAVEGARNHGLLNIAINDFFNTKHVLPTNKQEQEKIAKFLIEVNKKIELLENKLQRYQDFKKYLMQQIFAQKLRFDNFENEWEYKKLGQVSIVKDGTHDSPKYVSNGYPLITSKNLLNGEIDFKNVNYISKEDYDAINKRSNVDKGDILFGMIGTIGNPLIVETDDFAIKNVALIKEKEGLLNKFLIYVLETDFINKQFYRLNAGGTQKFIALGLIKDLLVPIPSIKEQLKISEFLSIVDINLNSYKNQISNMKKFKKGLLQQMFI